MKLRRPLNCFKAYDIRGRLGEELNEAVAYRVGQAVAHALDAQNIVLGFDARETSPQLANSIKKGICYAGANALEIGLAGTEEMYWAVSEFKAEAGIEVTASHNPIDYNGMKIVKSMSQPLSEAEFSKVKLLAEENDFSPTQKTGSVFDIQNQAREAYIDKIISFINVKNLQPLKIVINSGNGTAGSVVDALDEKLSANGVKASFIRVHHRPDSSFPNGIPNPLLLENQLETSKVVKREVADFGVAFDGDFDRCFIFDDFGNFIPGEYIVGLLAEFFLSREKYATIIHDPRVIWNTQDVVNRSDGRAVTSKTGHAFMKEAMRKSDAIYGGEMSAHHYFRDFSFCDSGMIPWLLIWEILSKKNISLSDLIAERKRLFPSSGELNYTISEPSRCLKLVKQAFSKEAILCNEMDGLSMSFKDWRFNLRKSNTEALVRLNVEASGDQELLSLKTQQLENLIIDL